MSSKNKLDDLTGRRFGRWTVINKSSYVSGGNTYWNCRCDCGNEYPIQRSSLIFGTTKQCRDCAKKPKYIGNIHVSHFVQVAQNARRRKIKLDVSIDYLNSLWEKQNGRCALSGIKIEFQSRGPYSGTASLDRIDSNLGYIPGNVQWVHRDINWMKNKFTQHYFISLCHLVANNCVDN